jgi:hopanoid biosynthesis associated RND transporter like protein HpnN
MTAVRRPYLTLLIALAWGAVSGVSAHLWLEHRSQRNDLLNPNKPCQQRWQRFVERFGSDDDAVIVVAGSTPDRQVAAVESIAAAVATRPDLFDRIFYKIDLRPLRGRLLQYSSVAELKQIRHMLLCAEPLLGAQAQWAWRLLSLQTLLGRAVTVLHQPMSTPWEQALMQLLPRLLEASAAWLEGQTNVAPWGNVDAQQIEQSATLLSQPQYLRTPDGSMILLLCRPIGADASDAKTRTAVAQLRCILADVGQHYPDVELGLTGLPVLESDEMRQADLDTQWAIVWTLVGVTLLYAWAYRGLRYPLLTLTTLLIGTVWALGWATWTVGHLNILSAAFAVMMVGVGDYGVLWVARYDQGRQSGLSVSEAMMFAAQQAGPSIATAALTTGAAFGVLMAVDFQAVAELGWIAGCGVLLCAASCLTVLPALLVLSDRGSAPSQPTASPNRHFAFGAPLQRLTLILLGLALLVAVAGLSRVRYDHNLLHLQSPQLDSVQWEWRLTAQGAGWTWDAVSIAEDRAQAIALRQQYEALPQVSRVLEVASLLPADLEHKWLVLCDTHERLQHLPQHIPAPIVAIDPQRVVQLARQLAAALPNDASMQSAVSRFLQALQRQSAPQDALRRLDRWLSAELAAQLRYLQAISQPQPITVADIPQPLRERYVSRDGAFLVRAWAREDLWEYAALRQFLDAITQVDPEATGKVFRTYEGLSQMQRGFLRAALFSLVVVMIVLWFDLRRGRLWLAALLPLTSGLLLTTGLMAWCGWAWNPANVVALPLLLGIGVDNGVHVLHDYLQHRIPPLSWQMSRAVVRSILVAGLTTLIGFMTLAWASHRGLASLGWVMSLGIAACLLSALVLLPAWLRMSEQLSRWSWPSLWWRPWSAWWALMRNYSSNRT